MSIYDTAIISVSCKVLVVFSSWFFPFSVSDLRKITRLFLQRFLKFGFMHEIRVGYIKSRHTAEVNILQWKAQALQGTLSSAKQSSAELMATSSYPSHPYKSKPPGPLPHPCCPFSALELVPLAQKNPFRRKTVLMEAGRRLWKWRGGLFMGKLSEVNDKAHFCVGELELSH